jgi:arginase
LANDVGGVLANSAVTISSNYGQDRSYCITYHVGIRQARICKEPESIVANLTPVLYLERTPYRIETLGRVDNLEGELGRSFQLLRRILEGIINAVGAAELPVHLAGTCHSIAGVVAGLDAADLPLQNLDIFWTDASRGRTNSR